MSSPAEESSANNQSSRPRRTDKDRNKSLNGTRLQPCICKSSGCRALTIFYLDIDDGRNPHVRGGYISIPKTQTPDTAKGKVIMEIRTLIFVCVLGESAVIPPCGTGKHFVSRVHFPDAFLPRSTAINLERYVDRTDRQFAGLFDNRDYLRVKEGENKGRYYAGPILSFSQALELKDEYVRHNNALRLLPQSNSSPSSQSNPSSGAPSTSAPSTPQQPVNQRARPTEQKVRREARQIENDPGGAKRAASELAVLREERNRIATELAAVRDELEKERVEKKAMKKAWTDKEKMLRREKEQLRKALIRSKKEERTLERVMESLNPATLASDKWHAENKDAALALFGVKASWKETVVFLECCFPDLDTSQRGGKTVSKFEQLLLTLMRVRRGFELQTLHWIMGRKVGSVSDYVREWLPKLGYVGRSISTLDTDFSHDFISEADASRFGVPHGNGDSPATYFDASVTREYRQVGMEKVTALVDGKCFRAETPRKNSALNRCMQDSKTHGSAFLSIAWSGQDGLVFEATDLVCGRCSEVKLNQEWGKQSETSLGPVEEEAEAEGSEARRNEEMDTSEWTVDNTAGYDFDDDASDDSRQGYWNPDDFDDEDSQSTADTEKNAPDGSEEDILGIRWHEKRADNQYWFKVLWDTGAVEWVAAPYVHVDAESLLGEYIDVSGLADIDSLAKYRLQEGAEGESMETD